MRRPQTTQGFTLIELLIVIAIIGILAAVLIPNLLGAQKRAYDTGAQACARSIQTAQATYQIDAQTYFSVTKTAGTAGAPTTTPTTSDLGISSGCAQANIAIATTSNSVSAYTFTVKDARGSKTYTVTPSSISGASGV